MAEKKVSGTDNLTSAGKKKKKTDAEEASGITIPTKKTNAGEASGIAIPTKKTNAGEASGIAIPTKKTNADEASGIAIPTKKTNADEASGVAIPMKPLSPREQLMFAASPPKFVSLEDIMRMANGVSDMALAHEIAVGNDFRFQHKPPPENSIEHTVREVMQKAFWDALEEKLKKDPPDYSQALVLLQEVKENILELLLPQHQRIRENIEEVLDLQLIQQKAEHNSLDISYYANFVIGIMARLCAPVRDDQIAAIRQLTDVVLIYKEIFNVLNLMKLDMVNFTIDAVRPYVQQHSIVYERDKFADVLRVQKENGVDGLQFTKVWLTKVMAKLKASPKPPAADSGAAAASPNAPSDQTSDSKKQYKEVMNAAYMELLEWDEAQEVFPETLLIDQQRFLDLRNKVGWLILVSSILAVTYNTVGQAISGIAELKQKLKTQIEILTDNVTESQLPEAITNVAEQVNKEVNECLEKHTFKRLTEEQETLLKGQIVAIIKPDSTIFKLMKSRLFGFISTTLANPKSRDLQIPTGFSLMAEEISTTCGQFLRLISYNQAVFGSYYAAIIQEISSADNS